MLGDESGGELCTRGTVSDLDEVQYGISRDDRSEDSKGSK